MIEYNVVFEDQDGFDEFKLFLNSLSLKYTFKNVEKNPITDFHFCFNILNKIFDENENKINNYINNFETGEKILFASYSFEKNSICVKFI
jgi:hypothetical protein